MVEKDAKPAEKDSKDASSSNKKEKEKEVDTLPIETDASDEKEKLHELNDGDEFEEFPMYVPPETTAADEPPLKEVSAWQENWEDETVEKDFAQQLAEELRNPAILKPAV